MSLDARMRAVAREEIAAGPRPAGTDVSALEKQIADLHEELHAVVTGVHKLESLVAEEIVRINVLERQAKSNAGTAGQPEAEPAPRRARKATGE